MPQLFENFPAPDVLMAIDSEYPTMGVNTHIHTPYSFSAFKTMGELFDQALQEGIRILGINDFNTAEGFGEFSNMAVKNRIFPLFNMEFMGLIESAQEKGIRVNDPINPGRTYLCGKGFQNPFSMPEKYEAQIRKIVYAGQLQLDEMVEKLNAHFKKSGFPLQLSLNEIRDNYATDLVRERHIARAIKDGVRGCFSDLNGKDRIWYDFLAPGLNPSLLDDDVYLENVIRDRFLKKGGPGYVEESASSFLPVTDLIVMIRESGGIPCYPVLLDNEEGWMTEFENDWEALSETLTKMDIPAIELIPPRNDNRILKPFVEFFDSRGFVITFGTEHNTPQKTTLEVLCRGGKKLDPSLKNIGLRGAQVIAAHQYLVSKQKRGFLHSAGKSRISQKNDLESLGRNVLKWYFRNGVKSDQA